MDIKHTSLPLVRVITYGDYTPELVAEVCYIILIRVEPMIGERVNVLLQNERHCWCSLPLRQEETQPGVATAQCTRDTFILATFFTWL